MSSCYYDAYGQYYCNYYYLSTAARVGISIGVFAVVFALVALCMLRRRRQAAARNALLLQNQQGQAGLGNQWAPPIGQSPYGPPPGAGYPNAGGYPMQPNPTGGYGGYGGYGEPPKPFQPGYTGNYVGGPPGGEAPKGYDAAPGMNSQVQVPPTSYNPEAPFHNPTPAPAAPAVNNAANDPPSYSGYSAPGGPPAGVAPGGSNPYYTPPDTRKT